MSDSTPDYYNKKLGGVKADPYRICKLYGIAGGPHEHITKKCLRGVNKDDGINTELDLIKVLRGQLDRWEEMIKEDEAEEKPKEYRIGEITGIPQGTHFSFSLSND